jgi:hypothetical protein
MLIPPLQGSGLGWIGLHFQPFRALLSYTAPLGLTPAEQKGRPSVLHRFARIQ